MNNLEKLKRVLKRFKSIKIAKIFGIDIELHWTWFLILFYFSWMLACQILPKIAPEQPNIAYWFFGIISALMLFVSVLFHELAHSKVAQLFKISVKRITLMLLGGMAEIGDLSKSAKSEFFIAIAGPISSTVLAGIFWALGHFLKTNIELVIASLNYLFVINIILAVFNLLPAYPMDGGRVFKTILWAISKNQLKSLKIATLVGQAFAISMIIAGIFKFGFWFILVGWFLLTMAPAEYRQLLAKTLLNQCKAREIMSSIPAVFAVTAGIEKEIMCDAEDSLEIVYKKMKDNKCSMIFVTENDRVIGMITITGIENYKKAKM